VAVYFHDVPEDGTPTDLNHRLGPNSRFLRDPGPEATGQNHYLHSMPPSGGLVCRLSLTSRGENNTSQIFLSRSNVARVRWPRLSEQSLRVNKWRACQA